jgi:hypothetical protein
MFMVAEMRKEKVTVRTKEVSGGPDSVVRELRRFRKGITS